MKASTLSIILVAATLVPVTGSAQSNEVAVVSWGGSYQEAQREAYFTPFSEESGVTVIEGTGPQIERTRAEVESGDPSFDLTATNQSFNMIGEELGLWEPIDYSYFDNADIVAIPERYRQKYGVGAIVYANAIAFSTDIFPDSGPQPSGWADFWDVKKFPGKRAMSWCDVSTDPVPEAALLADGVPVDKIYPIDIPRAVRKLKELSPNIVWTQNFEQQAQLLASGEVAAALVPTGRVQPLIDEGAALKIDWNQGRYTFDVWYVLKGARNPENAMRLIAYAVTPGAQAKMAEMTGHAPTNPRAMELLDDEVRQKLPTYPDNFAQQFEKNEEWWKDHRDEWVDACKAGLM